MEGRGFSGDRGVFHAYIAAAQGAEARERLEQRLAMAAVCSGTGRERPCGVCRDCRKARDGVHPDVIHVRRETDERGKTRREIRVDQVREMIAQAQVMPNEAPGKAFVVHEAETMNPNAQNALLKLLEEPPRGVVLILSTAAPSALLPTVRSRCVELNEHDDCPVPDGDTAQMVTDYLQQVAGGKKSELLAWCNERAAGTDNAAASAFVSGVEMAVTDMLCARRKPILDREACRRILKLMDTCRSYLEVNVGIKHLFGVIAVKSIGESSPEK